jgi:hypothetical protein
MKKVVKNAMHADIPNAKVKIQESKLQFKLKK